MRRLRDQTHAKGCANTADCIETRFAAGPKSLVQGGVRIFVFEARGVGLIHAVVRLWLTCWPFKAKGTLST